LKKKIKIRIVVVDQDAKSAAKQSLKSFLSPVLSKLDVIPKLGMFHSALIVGPWLVEWNNSALCIPRKCLSRAAMLTADIDEITSLSNLEEVTQKLSEVIVQWNVSMQYKSNGGDKKIFGNCQDFIDAILSKLDIKLNFSGTPLGEFLTELKDSGRSNLNFKMNEDFMKNFQQKEKLIEFKTHKDLDLFLNNLLKIEPDFKNKYKSHWNFLKSFDRAFWMRYFKASEVDQKSKNKLKTLEDALINQKDEMTSGDIDKLNELIKKVKKEISDNNVDLICVSPFEKESVDEDGDKFFDECCPFSNPLSTNSLILN